MKIFKRRQIYTVQLPIRPFLLHYPKTDDYDGPFDPAEARFFDDGSVGFVVGTSSPRVIRAVYQDGPHVITKEGDEFIFQEIF